MTTAAVGKVTERTATAAGERGRVRPLTLGAVIVAFCILVGLGTWQLHRLEWKTQLLQRVAALQAAAPLQLSTALDQLAKGADLDFTRVVTRCPSLERTPTLRLYALDDRGMGYRLITACPVEAGPYRSILVDRGFVPRDEVARVRPSDADLRGPVVGVLRQGDKPGWLTPKHTAASADWYGRDLPAMAAELKASAPAPIFLMLESPAPRAFGPAPSPLPGEIRNPHLGYAITWFGLAAALVGVYLATLMRRKGRG